MTAACISRRPGAWFRITGWVALALMLQQPVLALAQAAGDERRLQGGDAITLTVAGRPDLDQALVLDGGGRVSLPQVGEVALGGLTVSEAREILRQRLRVFYPSIASVEVELQSASQVRMYVLGEVQTSGPFDFASVPSIWDLLRAAGGPGENANLAGARVVRVVDGRTEVLPVNLSGVMEGTTSPDLVLESGDTLVVPALREGVANTAAAEGVQVFGAVGLPTVVSISEPTELVQVMMLAGAPLVNSDLRKIQWVHRGPNGPAATRVDVRRFLEEGDPAGNPLVYPGDTLEVAVYQEPWIARRLPLILGFIATAATTALAYDRIVND